MANTYFKSFINKASYDDYVANTELPSIFVGYCGAEDEVYYLKDSPEFKPFTITAVDQLTVHFHERFYYSTDNGQTWNYNPNEWTDVPLQPDDTLQLRGNFDEQINNDWIQLLDNNPRFKLSGNVMSLYYADAYYKTSLPEEGNRTFANMFQEEYGLVDVSGLALPNNAPDGAFREMFRDCKNLTNAGFTINAKNSGIQSYLYMFYGCNNLTTAPTINVKNICHESMLGMFQGCYSLVNGPDLSSITGFVSKNGLSTSGSFKSMFEGCTSLTNIPMVPAIDQNAYTDTYEAMFKGCSALTTAPAFTIRGADYGGDGGNKYPWMFQGCSSLSDTSNLIFSTEGGYVYFFNSWTVQIFEGCTSLTNIRFTGSSLPEQWPSDWLDNTTGGTITIDAGQSTSDWESALGLDTSIWTCVEAQS